MLRDLILAFIIFSILAILILVGLGRNPNQAVRLVVVFWKKIFIDLIDELFGKHVNQILYPFVFGIDAMGNVDLNEIDANFEDLYRVFEQGNIYYDFMKLYPQNVTVPQDIICYHFCIFVEDKENWEKMKKKIPIRINGIVNRRLKEYGYYNVASSPFWWWGFNSNENPTFLKIYFALTPKGVEEIKQKKLQVAYEWQKKNRKSSTNFKTDWKSGESKDGKH